TTTLDYERSAVGTAVVSRKALERSIQYARERQSNACVRYSTEVRAQLAERWIEAAAARLLSLRVATLQASGVLPNAEASISKLFTSELLQRIWWTSWRLLGPYGALVAGSRAPLDGGIALAYQESPSRTIAGGTSE